MRRLSMAEESVKEGSIVVGSGISNSTFCELGRISCQSFSHPSFLLLYRRLELSDLNQDFREFLYFTYARTSLILLIFLLFG